MRRGASDRRSGPTRAWLVLPVPTKGRLLDATLDRVKTSEVFKTSEVGNWLCLTPIRIYP